MAIYFQPNRNLYKFWEERIKDLMVFKGVTDADIIDSIKDADGNVRKDIFGNDKNWDGVLDDEIDEGFDELDQLAFRICHEIYAKATLNASPQPPVFTDLLNELPDETGVIVPRRYNEEYEEVKEEIIKNCEVNLKIADEDKKKKGVKIITLKLSLLNFSKLLDVDLMMKISLLILTQKKNIST